MLCINTTMKNNSYEIKINDNLNSIITVLID